MTREELRDYVNEQRTLNNIPYHVYSALIDGIDTLEQEPSGDLISRGEVLKNAFKIYTHECGLLEVVGVATIETLPSVKPQTGHWIIMGDRYIKCSECGHITKTESPDIYHFCMVCGAKMSENPTGSKPEISSYYGLRSYVGKGANE